MEKKEVDKKFTWVIKNFSSLDSKEIYSDKFDVRGCKWHLSAYPKGMKVDNNLSLFLEVADYRTLPSGWRRHARYHLTVVNQCSEKLSRQHREIQHWFDEKSTSWGFPSMIPLSELNAKDSGFLVNGELKIVVELDLLEVIGKVVVNGFQLLPSQVEFVSRIFEKHPDVASEFVLKNPNLRTGYMSFLLGLIESMCQPPHEISKDDLSSAYAALGFMKDAGFKLDWLEKKLDEVSENKENELANETRVREMEEEVKELKRKYLEMEAMVEKEKAKVSAAKAPLSFNDVV